MTPVFYLCIYFVVAFNLGVWGFVCLVGWLVDLVEIGSPSVAQAGRELTTVTFPQSQVLGLLL